MRNREIKFLGKTLKKRSPDQDNLQYFEEIYQEYDGGSISKYGFFIIAINELSRLGSKADDDLVKAVAEMIDGYRQNAEPNRAFWLGAKNAIERDERLLKFFPKGFLEGLLDSGVLDQGLRDKIIQEEADRQIAATTTFDDIFSEQTLPNHIDYYQKTKEPGVIAEVPNVGQASIISDDQEDIFLPKMPNYRPTLSYPDLDILDTSKYAISEDSQRLSDRDSNVTDQDYSDIKSFISRLESDEDALLALDNLSIPCIKGNVKDPEEKKKKFPEVKIFGNLPIELYDWQGLVELQKQINETSLLEWQKNGSCKHPERQGHKALISYSFDGTNYRVIIAQQGRVSVNFVSPEYMQSQIQQLEKITSEIRSKIPQSEYGDNIDKIALSNFYQNKLAEISKASKEVVVNSTETQETILDEFGGYNPALEHLISATSPAPINIDCSGYSIAREATKQGNNIRITCMSDKDGNFRDNVMYVNVTGTNFYVKIQVARGDEPENKINGHECKKGDIIIFPDLYSEPKIEGLMPKDRKLTDKEKEALENCHIIASAVIHDNSDKVQISCSVKFGDKIKRQQVKKENKKDILVKASKTGRNIGGDFTAREDDDEIIMI